MLKIFNTALYGLRESIIRSGYPMKKEVAKFNWDDIYEEGYDRHKERAIRLANAPIGSGHDNFLKGIIVQMDVEAPSYIWPQLQRYQFFTITSSTSKMHSLSPKDNETWEELLGNMTMDFELTAGISTNYMCLKNMYHQRKNHRLKFWTEIFCPWVESLPMAKELIIGNRV